MQSSIISTLSFLMIANSTLKSSHLLSNQYEINLAVLPRFSLSTLTLQNIFFKQINLIHFTPITFNGCLFGSSSVYIESNDILKIQNCNDLAGYIQVKNTNILVNSTKLSKNFTTFNIMNGKGIFMNSKFTSYSIEPVISTLESEIDIQNCNFSNCYYGGIKSLKKTNLTIFNCIFSMMKAEEGAAINFNGDSLRIQNCIFIKCNSLKAGGAIKIEERSESHILNSSFIQNKSPRGNSIYVSHKNKLFISNCNIPSYSNEIYNELKNNIIVKIGGDDGNHDLPQDGNEDSTGFTKSNYFTLSDAFSSSLHLKPPATHGFSPSSLFTASSQFSKSNSFAPTREFQASVKPIKVKSSKNTSYLIFVVIICVVVVVIAIVAVTAILVQKKKNQIYPSDYDGEEEEPKKTTVTIANINDVDV